MRGRPTRRNVVARSLGAESLAQSFDGSLHVGGRCGKRYIKQGAPGNGNQVQAYQTTATHRIRMGQAEDLSKAAFRAGAHDGIAELARRDEAKAIDVALIGKGQQGDQAGRHPPALRLDCLELVSRLEAHLWAETDRHQGPGGQTSHGLAGRHRNALAALVAAALENQSAVLGPHPDEKAVGAATTTVVGLVGSLHNSPCQGTPCRGKLKCYPTSENPVNVHGRAGQTGVC